MNTFWINNTPENKKLMPHDRGRFIAIEVSGEGDFGGDDVCTVSETGRRKEFKSQEALELFLRQKRQIMTEKTFEKLRVHVSPTDSFKTPWGACYGAE